MESKKFLIGGTRFQMCNELKNFDCRIQSVIKKELDEKTETLSASYWEITKDDRLLKAGTIHDVFDYIRANPWVGVTDLKLYRNRQIVAKSTI